MTTGQKVMAGLLVLITGLFVAAVAGQDRSKPGGASAARTGAVALLHRWIGDPPRVRLAEIAAPDCPPGPGGVLTVRAHCVLRVAAGRAGTRRLTLRAQQPLTVTAPVPQRGPAQTHLDAGTEATVAVERGGADVTVDCDTGTCAATLVGGG
jgi:hypothetical protein